MSVNTSKPNYQSVEPKSAKDDAKIREVKKIVANKYNKKKFFGFWKRLFLAFFAVYFSFSYSYNLFGPRKYDYRDYNFFEAQVAIMLQPVMEILANGKVSHWYDWDDTEVDASNADAYFVPVRGSGKPFRDHSKDLSFNNLWKSFNADEFAKIKPKNYDKKWSLIYCTEEYNICKESNLTYKGEIKIIVDGNGWLAGRGENDEMIKLDTIKTNDYFEKGQYPGLILI